MRPLLAITLGDPAGVGPEITVKALANPEIYKQCRPLVIGEGCILQQALKTAGLEESITIREICEPEEGAYTYGVIDVISLGILAIGDFEYGKVSALCGEASFQYVKKAIELAMAHKADATVTNPICKEALNLSGQHYSGHTEIYADLTGTRKYTMLLADDDMLVSHVSTHVSLREACERVKKDRILDVIELTAAAARKIRGQENPKIAVAGLNPHCSENGLFGTEEAEEIRPAVETACQRGYSVEGPVPPDTVFSKLRGGWYDAVIAMYHDQGHIPIKVVGFQYDKSLQKWASVKGVNITLGLPIIRTSVDHGTAFDLAWKGGSNEVSLLNAIDYAARLAQ